MARYEAGETLASIARTYDCSPPAISYVVSRSRMRNADAEMPAKPPVQSEPQLIKAGAEATPPSATSAATDATNDGTRVAVPAYQQMHRDTPPPVANGSPAALRDHHDHRASPPANGFIGNGAGGRPGQLAGVVPRPAPSANPAAQANGDHRRTLHLSLGSPTHGNGSPPAVDSGLGERHDAANYGSSPQQRKASDPMAQPVHPAPQHAPGSSMHDHPGNGSHNHMMQRQDASEGPDRRDGNGAQRRDNNGSAYIDQELRARVDNDIAVFLAAFDDALVQDTQESRSALREATDRLLRAGARTRIELERLEARMPLTPRDGGRSSEPVWRQR